MKKQNLKRLLCGVLAVLMMAALAACGGNSDDNSDSSTSAPSTSGTQGSTADPAPADDAPTSNPVSDVPVTFTFMYSGEYNANYKCLEKMRELTNVTLDVTDIPDSDYDTRNQLIINTGEDMPDLISKTKPKAAQALSGILLPISDYYDQMPNFMKFIEDNDLQYLIDNATQSDGKVYELPVNTKEVKTSSKQIYVRKDVFEENNIAIPTTYDELYEAAKKLKEIYPSSQPIQVIYGNGNLIDMIAPSFGTSGGWGSGPDKFQYDEANDEWIYAPTSEEYKVMLQYLNKLYSEGLLNQEYTTFSSDMYAQNASTDTAFVLLAEWLGCETDYNTALREAGDENAEWVPIFPLEGPAGAYVSRVSNSTQTMVIAASAKDKDYFPALIRWLDWMYTDEAADLWSWGIEGETYTVDSNGNKKYMENVAVASNPNGDWDIAKDYGVRNNCFTFVYPYEEELGRMQADYLTLIQEESDRNAVPAIMPSIALTEDQVEIQSLYSTNLSDYVDQMTTKFIMGGESFDNWDNFVSECNNKGVTQLSELYNEAWQARGGN